ncbi:hypothetical protein QCA50_001232 [Cerrena zonata]|uniref:Xylanolytic transcriptional activator regulatory domain-containing protein n=1 Tax=Cerrena zonata TaxID=2478898 RepID=A0AAW0GYE0_9APHY
MPGNTQIEHESTPSNPGQHSRQKQPRSSSPGPSTSNHSLESRPPPTKRARKAINCEPCRNSKLKCDRLVLCSNHCLVGKYIGALDVHSRRDDTKHTNSSESAIVREYRPSCPDQNLLHFAENVLTDHLLAVLGFPGIARAHHASFVVSTLFSLITLLFSNSIFAGTTAHCYQGQDSDSITRNDDALQARVDPSAEFNRIRHSLSLLESYIYQPPNARLPATSLATPSVPIAARQPSAVQHPGESSREVLHHEHIRSQVKGKALPSPDAPGMLGQQGTAGYYAGPTSAVSHLITVEKEENDAGEPASRASYERGLGDSVPPNDEASRTIAPRANAPYDQDLVSMLPPVHTVDGLIEYYFEYCNWIYRHVNHQAFLAAWDRFKNGIDGDRIILATVCILISLTVRYLPDGHALLNSLAGTVEDIGRKYYDIMLDALDKHNREMRKDGGRGYTLELVELLLVRCHYLTYAKEDPEETWRVRGELVSVGTALGLHRDPGNSRFPKLLAERRRWAWWHIILLERWQAFMFGRPLAIATNHFNTLLPSYCDPSVDKSGRLYLPNIALFKLAYILGDIMEDAVSFRAVSYSSIQEGDKLLTQWIHDLPTELDLDEYHIARSLGSPIVSIRRLGVQSVIIRTAYHHIRFTLHRPYAHIPSSLNIAVSAASALITLVGQTRPDFISNTALAVPGHMNWGPFHIFSAAMFFSFQLIARPDQPGATLFRENIRKVTTCLEQSRGMPVADKALTILQALAPLYSDDFASEVPIDRKRKKASVLTLVRTLAFPYQEPPQPRYMSSSPALSGGEDTDYSESPSTSRPPYDQSQLAGPSSQPQQHPVSSVRYDTNNTHAQPPVHQQSSSMHPISNDQQQMLLASESSSSLYPAPGQASTSYANNQSYHVHNQVEHQPMPPADMAYTNHSVPYSYPADESSMWGASIGFGLGEWAQFVNYIQGPEHPHRPRGGPM